MSRRHGITPPVLLAVLGILIVSIVAFLLATQLGGGEPSAVAQASPSATPPVRSAPTQAPRATAQPSADPGPTASPKPRYYRVKAGDSLISIAARFDVKPQHLQCLNGILDRNIVVLGARYEIPPEGFSCPPGWRRATPAP